MPAPDSTIEDVRTSVLKYIRMYEEGEFTLSDLAAELGVMAPAYRRAMGQIEDHWGELLAAAADFKQQAQTQAFASYDDLEQALTKFRRTEAAWE